MPTKAAAEVSRRRPRATRPPPMPLRRNGPWWLGPGSRRPRRRSQSCPSSIEVTCPSDARHSRASSTGRSPDRSPTGTSSVIRRRPDGAPNVLLVLIDDAGFGNPSTFGGPIQTPNYTRMADGGVRYNRFHVTAICSPTRAALLTGRNSHAVGFGSVGEFAGGYPGYSATLPRDCAPLPRILRDNGYNTAAFGKWHLTPDGQQGPGGPFDRWPTGWGFEYFYGFLGGGAGQWDTVLAENQKIIGVDPALRRRDGARTTCRTRWPTRPSSGCTGSGPRTRRSRSSPSSRPAAATPRTTSPSRGRPSTRASSTRAGTVCARRRSPASRRSASCRPTRS